MNKILILACVLAISLLVSCKQPCAKIADQVCLRSGSGAAECTEVRAFSEQAGRTERHYCEVAVTIIEKLKGSATTGKAGDQVR
jgi:hypothetical protein